MADYPEKGTESFQRCPWEKYFPVTSSTEMLKQQCLQSDGRAVIFKKTDGLAVFPDKTASHCWRCELTGGWGPHSRRRGAAGTRPRPPPSGLCAAGTRCSSACLRRALSRPCQVPDCPEQTLGTSCLGACGASSRLAFGLQFGKKGRGEARREGRGSNHLPGPMRARHPSHQHPRPPRPQLAFEETEAGEPKQPARGHAH